MRAWEFSVRNAEALEVLEKVDTLLTDKTGTLTEGRPAIAKIVAVPRLTESDVLRLAASLERASEHPLAAAIVNAAASQRSTFEEVRGFRTIPGKGIVGAIDGRAVAFGNLKLLEGLAVDPETCATRRRFFEGTDEQSCFSRSMEKLQA